MDDSTANSGRGRLSSVLSAKLLKDTFDVRLYRMFSDVESMGNLLIQQSLGYQSQYLNLPCR